MQAKGEAMKKTIQIGLLWHSFRSGNLGVGALSVCNIHMIDRAAKQLGIEATYLVVGNSGPCNYIPVEFLDRFEFVHFSANEFLKSPLRITKKIASCDIVFDIGEGDSYSDIYGLARLAKLSFSKLVATVFHHTLVLSPQTIGPFSTAVGKFIAANILNRASYIVARDKLSTIELKKLNISNSTEAIDVAFALPFDRSISSNTKPKIRFGLNVSGLLFHGGYNRNNQFGLASDYREFTHELIRNLLQNDQLELHLVPHVVSTNNPIEDDFQVCEQLVSIYPSLILPRRFESPSEAKSYISSMHMFAGARMHSTIAAFSAGVPVFPLAYSRKFAGLFESIGYTRVLDMRELDESRLISKILEGLHSIDTLKQEVAIANSFVKERLVKYETVIKESLQRTGELA